MRHQIANPPEPERRYVRRSHRQRVGVIKAEGPDHVNTVVRGKCALDFVEDLATILSVRLAAQNRSPNRARVVDVNIQVTRP